jgi:benzoylformate decarboxylase
MRGIQVFMDSLDMHGVDCIFGNPGTTENPLLDSLIDHTDIKYYVALHEGVAVGAAGYYAQASGKTGVANVHVAPGLGNAIGMMYNALKANSPLVVTAGQQDNRMKLREPLLSHDLVAMAAPVTKWSAEPATADEVGPMMRKAFKIANESPKGPVFVALPINVMEQETSIAAETSGEIVISATPDAEALSRISDMFIGASNPAIIAGDEVPRTGALPLLIHFAEKTGSSVYHDGLRSQVTFPSQHPAYCGRLPFEAGSIRKMLSKHDLLLVTDGATFDEVWFDEGGLVPETTKVVQIGDTMGRLAQKFPVSLGVLGNLSVGLQQLLINVESDGNEGFKSVVATRNQAMKVRQEELIASADERLKKQWDARPMAPARAVHEIQSALPKNAIIVDESITASIEVQSMPFKEAGDFYGARGGGIGQGLAGALGIQVAHPDRVVVCISGDGSAMYSIQAFWTAARHNLPIVFIIMANREYRVLKHNLDIYRNRFNVPSNRPYPFMDIAPELDFVSMSKGMGVNGQCIEDADELKDAIKKAIALKQPCLIEVVVSGKQ